MKNRKPSSCFQKSDGAAQIQAPSDDVNLAKFRKEVSDDFLGLGINGFSRNCKKNPKSAINLGKFVKGIGVNLGIGIDSTSNHGLALNPTPLSSYHPTQGYKDFSSSSSSDHGASSSSCFAMLEQKDDKSNVKKKKKNKGGPKRSRVDESVHPEPINPPEELLRIIGPSVRPVFLYRKQLVEWDTREDQNRLFVNDRKRLMDFMTEEERLAVEDPKRPGIDVVGIDCLGRKYDMHTNKWESLDKVVVKRGWHKILAANGAEKGNWVHLWAFRRDDARLCLFVDFRHQP